MTQLRNLATTAERLILHRAIGRLISMMSESRGEKFIQAHRSREGLPDSDVLPRSDIAVA